MPKNLAFSGWIVASVVLLSLSSRAAAESFKHQGTEFNAVRSVTVPAGKQYSVIVTEFFHQGEIRPDGKNVVVMAQNRPAPMRVLQVGPGDFCRLAFQPLQGQSEYDIYYGGDPPTEKSPAWTNTDGLLLETRQFAACDMQSLDGVRGAYEKAAPIGADYVEGVFHCYNPCVLAAAPFFSHYSGVMEIRKAATYGFMVSSQDASFLLVDDKLVVSAPGHHGPTMDARPGCRQDVKLAPGMHKFDYYHAAAGGTAIMAAAWEIDPTGEKPVKPVAIPSDVFRTHLIGRLPATRLVTRTVKQVPDFIIKVTNEVLLPENETPLVGVLFRDVSAKSLTMSGTKVQWDFGDGQTSDLLNVDHVYLRPGIYPVKLSVRRGGKTLSTTNRINVDRPHPSPKDRTYTFADYLKILETYDPKTLDAPALLQLVAALEAKALALSHRAEDETEKAKASEEDPNRRPTSKKEAAPARKAPKGEELSESDEYLAKIVAAGKAVFTEEAAAKGDEDLLKLADITGPMARDRLGDSLTAFIIWQGAAQRIGNAEIKAECEIHAADIAINDLLKVPEAKRLLESAAKRLGKGNLGPISASLQRTWGDYYAASGDGKAARSAYIEAERLGGMARPLVETQAQRGAHTRSTEEFVKEKQFARAAEEIHAWERDFPTEKIEGYLTLLYARYWAARGKYAQAIAQTERLQTVSPDSPYMDQLLMTAADCEMRRGRKDRALATLHSLLKDYPGSPLVPVVKKNIAALESEGDGEKKSGKK